MTLLFSSSPTIFPTKQVKEFLARIFPTLDFTFGLNENMFQFSLLMFYDFYSLKCQIKISFNYFSSFLFLSVMALMRLEVRFQFKCLALTAARLTVAKNCDGILTREMRKRLFLQNKEFFFFLLACRRTFIFKSRWYLLLTFLFHIKHFACVDIQMIYKLFNKLLTSSLHSTFRLREIYFDNVSFSFTDNVCFFNFSSSLNSLSFDQSLLITLYTS